MKLKEYFSRVAKVLSKHIADAELSDALAEGQGFERGKVSAGYNRIFAEIRNAIGKNKEFLGVFEGNGQGRENPESIKEKEIDPKAMKRHMLAVRHDLRHYEKKINGDADPLKRYENPESIMLRVLNDLTVALKIKDAGGIFSAQEIEEYEAAFGRETKQKTVKTDKTGNNAEDQKVEVRGEQENDLQWRREPIQTAVKVKATKKNSGATKPSKKHHVKESVSAKMPPPEKSRDPRETMSAKFADLPPRGTPEYDLFMEIFIQRLREEGKIK